MAQYEFITRNGSGRSKKKATADTAGLLNVPKKTANTVKAVIAAVGFAEQVAIPVIAHRVNTVSLRTGQDELQQKRQFQFDMVKKHLSVAQFAIIGATVGGGAGAVISATVGATAQLINAVNQMDTVNMQRQVENISISMANSRAGSLGDRYSANG